MKLFFVKKYEKKEYELWNAFVEKAKNATFLFHRDFMEYHTDRFEDFSLMVFDEKNNLVSILPANRVEETLHSHQGLTYGGFVFTEKTKLTQTIEIVKSVLKFLAENKISKLYLKQIPSIYCDLPSDELEYISYLLDAKLMRCDSLSVIDLRNPLKFSEIRKRGINKGYNNDLKVVEDNNFELFWNQILIPNLNKKHKANPVHSIEEITLLKDRFPENIKQFNVYQDGEIVAGTTLFLSKNVIHSQYISGTNDNNINGSLDFLYNHLLKYNFNNQQFFDFGISNENNGKNLNHGLNYWKESFGARTVVQNFYEIDTLNYVKLENVLL